MSSRRRHCSATMSCRRKAGLRVAGTPLVSARVPSRSRYLPRRIVSVVKSLSRVVKSSGSIFMNVIAATRSRRCVRAECYYGSSFNSSAVLLAYQQRATTTVSRNRSANNPRAAMSHYGRARLPRTAAFVLRLALTFFSGPQRGIRIALLIPSFCRREQREARY